MPIRASNFIFMVGIRTYGLPKIDVIAYLNYFNQLNSINYFTFLFLHLGPFCAPSFGPDDGYST